MPLTFQIFSFSVCFSTRPSLTPLCLDTPHGAVHSSVSQFDFTSLHVSSVLSLLSRCQILFEFVDGHVLHFTHRLSSMCLFILIRRHLGGRGYYSQIQFHLLSCPVPCNVAGKVVERWQIQPVCRRFKQTARFIFIHLYHSLLPRLPPSVIFSGLGTPSCDLAFDRISLIEMQKDTLRSSGFIQTVCKYNVCVPLKWNHWAILSFYSHFPSIAVSLPFFTSLNSEGAASDML